MCSLLEEQIIGSTHSVLSVCLRVVAIQTKTESSISGMEEGTIFSLFSHFNVAGGQGDSDSPVVHRQARLANQKEIPCLLQRHFQVWHRLERT